MIVGILSDSHGRFEATKIAVTLLRSRGALQLFHCGDVGGADILDLLAGNEPPAAFVFGNNDYDRDELASYAKSIGVNCLGAFGEVTVNGKIFAVTHGDNVTLVRRVLTEQSADYLLVGHSHVKSDSRSGRVRVINPGALYRAATKTVALLDTVSDRLEFLTIDAPR